MSDVLSLTLPKLGSRTRVKRRRRRKPPPNWKYLLALMVMDLMFMVAYLLKFLATGDWIWVLAITLFVMPFALLVSRWQRPDGGLRPGDYSYYWLLLPCYVAFIVLSFMGA